jgi:hypothetical protein
VRTCLWRRRNSRCEVNEMSVKIAPPYRRDAGLMIGTCALTFMDIEGNVTRNIVPSSSRVDHQLPPENRRASISVKGRLHNVGSTQVLCDVA